MEELETAHTRMRICPPVFFGSAALILALVAFGVAAPALAAQLFNAIQAWVTNVFGWFYLLAVAIFLTFVVVLAFTSYGAIKLGPDHSTPDYANISWFAMLFSAGMGIGLLFFGVAEPIMHYMSPPRGEGRTIAPSRQRARRCPSLFFIGACTPGRFTRSSGCRLPISVFGIDCR